MTWLKSWFALPGHDAPPGERVAWARRMEITGGITALAGADLAWSTAGWWKWVVLAAGLLALSPWPGPGAILRKARTRPEVLSSNPHRARRRGRRALKVMLPLEAVVFTAVGYALLGWAGAAFFVVIGLVAGGLGAWLYLKMEPD